MKRLAAALPLALCIAWLGIAPAAANGPRLPDGSFLGAWSDWAARRASEDVLASRRVKARGLYINGWTAGRPRELGRLLDLIDATELNAAVVDVKDSTGRTTYETSVEAAVKAGAASRRIPDVKKLLAELRRRSIYPIARLVVFQDPVLAGARPDLAVRSPGGGVWADRSGLAWVDPYSREVWEYNLSLAGEAVALGFAEIQFDYVRFPSDGRVKGAEYPHYDGRSREDVIAGFLRYARRELRPLGVFVSADIFGLVPTASDDMGIGQYYEKVVRNVDFVSPMAYPSHYALGSFGIPDPDASPYDTVSKTLRDCLKRRTPSGAVVRPWLQDFSLRNHYGSREVRAQIQAVMDSGLDEFLLWNPANVYTDGALERAPRPWGRRPQPR